MPQIFASLQSFLTKILPFDITKGALGSLGLNIIYQCLLLAIMALLTRLMDISGFGQYSVVMAIIVLIGLPFAGGMPVFMLRHVSAYYATQDYARLTGLLRRSFIWVSLGTILLTFLVSIIISLNVFALSDVMRTLLLTALPAVSLTALILFFGSILRGFKHVILGRLGEFFVQPAILCMGLTALFFAGLQASSLTAHQAISLHVGSLGIAAITSLVLCIIFIPKHVFQTEPTYDQPTWLKSAIPLIFAIGLVTLNAQIDIVMVGFMAGDEEAGYYRTASRLAAIVPFFLIAMNNAMGPSISGLYAKGDIESLQSLLIRAARIAFVLTLPLAGLLCLFPGWTLSILFGEGFVIASAALVILVVANLFNVFMGQVGQVMALTGYENYAALAVLVSTIANIGLNFWLIPLYGIEGAAIATGSSIIIWNALLVFWTRQKTGLHCTALGKFL